MTDEKLMRRTVHYVCVMIDMDADRHHDPQLHKLALDLKAAGVRCPQGFGGWRRLISSLDRTKEQEANR